MIEKVKVYVWTMIYSLIYGYQYWQTRAQRKKIRILTSEQTITEILSSHASVARFGDGELQMISHYQAQADAESFKVDTFQQYDPLLAARLWEVLMSRMPGLLLCLPYPLKNASVSRSYASVFWKREWLRRNKMLELLPSERVLGDTCFTRFYMERRDIADYPAYIRLLRKIWEGRDLLMVEGEYTRLGIGNDLFDNAKSIRRVLCPPVNVFGYYTSILEIVKREAEGKLVLIALGHTATVLAYDLHLLGFQALDVGHIDIEYEWYLMKAKKKVPVPSKYVNEVSSGRVCQDCQDPVYNSQIITTIK